MSVNITPFQIEIANTPESLKAVFQLRYQVYCKEKNFESGKQNQLEQDQFDRQSIHILIRQQHTQALVATMRLILADDPHQPFHFESLSHQTFELIHEKPRNHYGEISRLAIASDFRNEVSGDLYEQLEKYKATPLGLIYASLMVITEVLNIESVCILEPRFADYISRCGLITIPIGEPFEHNGTRVPYVLELNHAQRQHRKSLDRLYQALYKGLKPLVLQHPVSKLISR